MTSYQQTIAFFGATGGSACAALAYALKEGHHCTALARNPDNLRNLLKTKHELPTTTIEKYLRIHQGDAKTPLDVSKALVNPVDDKLLVDIIYTSIGSYPRFQLSLIQPLILKDPTICESGMAALFYALDQLAAQGVKKSRTDQKPLLIAVSSMASASLWHSLKWPLIPFYYWLLSSPHVDKLNMEKLIYADKGAHVRDFVIIRPAILTDGAERGVENVRAGWEWGIVGIGGREKEAGPALGWIISRRDIGGWVFKKVILEGGWEGRCVSLCY